MKGWGCKEEDKDGIFMRGKRRVGGEKDEKGLSV